MNLATKKLEIINWLTSLQDPKVIEQVNQLRFSNLADTYIARMKEPVDQKLARSRRDVEAGNLYAQHEVEDYFKNKG